MIYFDVTKAARSGHHSGLLRVSARLRAGLEERLGGEVMAVRWAAVARQWVRADGAAVAPAKTDWLFTPELFSETERPGFTTWLSSPGCRTAAVYHDAIPLRYPQITWPQSVARHPGYMKLLASFDRVLANSESSRSELEAYWMWAGLPRRPDITVLPLGADGAGRPRVRNRERPAGAPEVLLVGILEPRKNQTLLLDAADRLWASGLEFTVHLVGRVNPHFGGAIERRVRGTALRQPLLRFHGALADAEVAALAERSVVAVCPSIAEGNGLPVLEALWAGLPCLVSDIPALREHAAGGGCLVLPCGDTDVWTTGLRQVLTDELLLDQLVRGALNRTLPTWRDSAEAVLAVLT